MVYESDPALGPELKITNDQILRLSNQRAFVGEEIKALKTQRFELSGKIFTKEEALFVLEHDIHTLQRQIHAIGADARAAEEMEARAEANLETKMKEMLAAGKSPEEIAALLLEGK